MDNKHNKGDRFILEITDVFSNEDGEVLYQMNGFKSLVFDSKGMDKLEKYSEPSIPLSKGQ